MKPALNMEEGKPAAVIIQGSTEQPEKVRRSRLVKGSLIGLAVLVVIALVVGLSVYFGAKITRDNFKEAKQLYHTDDGKVVEETTKVTETEVSINVPNIVETVFDFKIGVIVDRYVDSETKTKSACYARPLNQSTAPTTDAERYEDQELDLNQKTHSQEQSKQKWVATTRTLAKHLVSENIAEMCKDTDIFWMERVEETDMEKRAACYYSGYTYVCYPRTYRCSYYCYFNYYCRTAAGTLVLYSKDQGWYCLNDCYPGTNNPIC